MIFITIKHLINRRKQIFTLLSIFLFSVICSPLSASAVYGGSLSPNTPYRDIGDFMGNIIQTVLIIAGLLLLAFLLIGGISYINSQGDKAQLEKAQKTLTYAFLGLVIVVAGFAIIKIVEQVFGIRILSGITFPGP